MAIETAQCRLTVDEYERMARLGIIGPDEKVELIDGTIVTVPPSGEAHSGGIMRRTCATTTRMTAHGDQARPTLSRR